jgi:hypothetical protein
MSIRLNQLVEEAKRDFGSKQNASWTKDVLDGEPYWRSSVMGFLGLIEKVGNVFEWEISVSKHKTVDRGKASDFESAKRSADAALEKFRK